MRLSLRILSHWSSLCCTTPVILPKAFRILCLRLLAVFSIIALSACSSTAYKSSLSPSLSSSQKINAPFFPQEKYQCGPAALATVLNYRDIAISPDALSHQVYIPERKGSLQLEMKAATRRAALVPYQLEGGLNALLQEVEAGNPVLVLQNLSFSWLPQWHYAVVIGYQLEQNQIILHSGTLENYAMPISSFLKTWQRAENWALVIMPAKQLPASANEKAYMQAATDLERIGQHNTASQAYRSALKKWPNNPIALLGVGNSYFQKTNYAGAIHYYQQALQSPQSEEAKAPVLNNLAYALHHYGCPALSEQAIDQALAVAIYKDNYLDSKQELQALNTKSKSAMRGGASQKHHADCQQISLNW